MRFHVVERAEPLFEFGARLGRLALARAESIAPRTIDDDRDDVLQRPAVLALQRRVEQAEQQQRRCQRPPHRRAWTPPQRQADDAERQCREPGEQRKRPRGREGYRPGIQCESLPSRSLAWTWSAL